MHFTKEDLKKLAKLCHIKCSEQEEERLLKNMVAILDYIDQLREADVQHISHDEQLIDSAPLAEDKPCEVLDRDTFLSNSPAHVGGMVRIPPVIQF